MEHKVLSSIREIVSLSIIGTLMLFFIAEIVLYKMCSLSIPSLSSPLPALPLYYGTGVRSAELHDF